MTSCPKKKNGLKNEERRIKEETQLKNLFIPEISIVKSRGPFLLLGDCIIQRIILKEKSDNAAVNLYTE